MGEPPGLWDRDNVNSRISVKKIQKVALALWCLMRQKEAIGKAGGLAAVGQACGANKTMHERSS